MAFGFVFAQPLPFIFNQALNQKRMKSLLHVLILENSSWKPIRSPIGEIYQQPLLGINRGSQFIPRALESSYSCRLNLNPITQNNELHLL